MGSLAGRTSPHLTLDRLTDGLLQSITIRTVTRKGVRFDSRDYVHPALSKVIGDEVGVFPAPDLSRLHVFDGAVYLCDALPAEVLATPETGRGA